MMSPWQIDDEGVWRLWKGEFMVAMAQEGAHWVWGVYHEGVVVAEGQESDVMLARARATIALVSARSDLASDRRAS